MDGQREAAQQHAELMRRMREGSRSIQQAPVPQPIARPAPAFVPQAAETARRAAQKAANLAKAAEYARRLG